MVLNLSMVIVSLLLLTAVIHAGISPDALPRYIVSNVCVEQR